MRLVNREMAEHPFHLHGQFFTVENNGVGTPAEPGYEDVILAPSQGSVILRARMDNPGRWTAHCHILEHAGLGMMSEFIVEPAP
jgi:FtsP/CotA-like multicopper oxidase with cupredoxin domain